MGPSFSARIMLFSAMLWTWAGDAGAQMQLCMREDHGFEKEYRTMHAGAGYLSSRITVAKANTPPRGEAGVREIKLEAFQFGFSPSIITVNRGDRVRLLATSRDVTHGVRIRAYDIDVPLNRGETKTIEFTADITGEFIIECSVYCGKGHQQMKARLIVEE